ncbi:MAG: hypothetical protein ABIH18_02385 [Candidatus Omnitrophota bacterium]
MFIDSAVKPSASPRGEPQNDKFEVFHNSLITGVQKPEAFFLLSVFCNLLSPERSEGPWIRKK